jgi:ubiquinone/menaquinone biosynthesis C-methylase UbiE
VRSQLKKGSGGSGYEILLPGCGSSSLGSHLYKEGYTNITCIDTSKVVISQMTDHYSDLDQMEYTTMDATHMEFIPENCFDLIIDKALFDCMLTTANNMTTVTNLVKEMYRVLKPGGSYIMISHSPPEAREPFLKGDNNCYDWKIKTEQIAKPPISGGEDVGEKPADAILWAYICKKGASKF